LRECVSSIADQVGHSADLSDQFALALSNENFCEVGLSHWSFLSAKNGSVWIRDLYFPFYNFSSSP
jgi:hypothetical protein